MKTAKTLSHKEVVKKMLDELKDEVAKGLPPFKEMNDFCIAVVLETYCHVVAPSFLRWMFNIWERCSEPNAKQAFAENIACEVLEDHPTMLRDYVGQIRSKHAFNERGSFLGDWHERGRINAKHLKRFVASITKFTTEEESVNGLLVAAALENASLVFIPWMKKAGKRLGFIDFTYVDKHGKADIKHARELSAAVESQAKSLFISPSTLTQSIAVQEVRNLLKGIFFA